MKYLIFVVLHFAVYHTLAAQNLIRNSSFETPTGNNNPGSDNDMDKCDFWNNAGGTCDWLRNEPNNFKVQESINGVFTNIPANTGTGYGGMVATEMIQHSFNSPLNSVRYKMTMFIRLSDRSMRFVDENTPVQGASWPDLRWPTGATRNLSIWTHDSRINYSNEARACGGGTNQAKEEDPVNVAIIPISINEYPAGEWHEISFEFVVSEFDHDWLGFEIDDCPGYLMVDDVSLEEIELSECSFCSPVDESINVSISGIHSETAPLAINGLENVSFIQFKIFRIPSEGLVNFIEFDNPQAIVEWNGKNLNGTEAVSGNYRIELVVGNECEYKQLIDNFVKSNTVGENTTQDPLTMDYTSKQPKDLDYLLDPCCIECIEISDNNNFIILEGNVTIAAIDKINLGPGVYINPNSNVTFKAGQEIILDNQGNPSFPAVTIEDPSSTVVDYIIEPCTENFNHPQTTKLRSLDIKKDNKIVQTGHIEIDSQQLEVSPNPTKGIFSVRWQGEYEASKLLITDANGYGIATFEIIKNQMVEVDISNQASGVYFVILKFDNELKVKKIVKK